MLECSVVSDLSRLLSTELLLGVNAHRRFGKVAIDFSGEPPRVQYGRKVQVVGAVANCSTPEWEEDADGWYRKRSDGSWEFKWRWRQEPEKLIWNGAVIYDRRLKSEEDKQSLRLEMESWIEQGFLVPYDEESMGAVGAILPINPVAQPGKTTAMRPTCDYVELNKLIVGTTDREHNEVCSESVRRWRRFGSLVIADLSKAYMRVNLAPELWRFQVIKWSGRAYALTRLGFGLVSAPRVLKVIMDRILKSHTQVLAFRDDLCVGAQDSEQLSEARVTMENALHDLKAAGFPAKEIVEVYPGSPPVTVLGLRLYTRDGALWWQRKAAVEKPEALTSLKKVAGVIGRIAPGHFPVQGWLRPYAQVLRSLVGREAADGWSREPSVQLTSLTEELVGMVQDQDPVGGRWCTDQQSAARRWWLYCDASQIAMASVLMTASVAEGGVVIEDACWMNQKHVQINVLETEAVVRGLGEVTKYSREGDSLTIVVDSKTAHSWIRRALNGEILRCKSLSSVLLLRRLEIISGLAERFQSVEVQWVASAENPADALTRVSSRWLMAWNSDKTKQLVGAVVRPMGLVDQIRSWQSEHRAELGGLPSIAIDGVECMRHGSRKGVYLPIIVHPFLTSYLRLRHEQSGHMGIIGMWHTVREEASFPKGKLSEAIKDIVRLCGVCNQKRTLPYRGAQGTAWGRYPWDEVFVDCMTLSGEKFRGVIAAVDGFSRLAEAKAVEAFSAANTRDFLEELRSRYGPPMVLRVDHGREFDNSSIRQWCTEHGTKLQFSSVANPRSQGIVERFNRTFLGILRVLAAEQTRPWNEMLATAMSIYNGRAHRGLDWKSPRDVFLGRTSNANVMTNQDELCVEEDRARLYEGVDWEFEELETTPRFTSGQPVHLRVQRPKEQFDWAPGVISQSLDNNAYQVTTQSGRQKIVHESNLKERSDSHGVHVAIEEDVEGAQEGEGRDRSDQNAQVEDLSGEIADLESYSNEAILHVEENFEKEVLRNVEFLGTPDPEVPEISESETIFAPRRSARKPKPVRKFDV